MDFFTNFNRPKINKGECFEQEHLCDAAGYRPVERLIEDMLSAGEQLANLRRVDYDVSPDGDLNGIEDSDIPALRRPGLDLVDVGNIVQAAVDVVDAVRNGVESTPDDTESDMDNLSEELPVSPKKPKKSKKAAQVADDTESEEGVSGGPV